MKAPYGDTSSWLPADAAAAQKVTFMQGRVDAAPWFHWDNWGSRVASALWTAVRHSLEASGAEHGPFPRPFLASPPFGAGLERAQRVAEVTELGHEALR